MRAREYLERMSEKTMVHFNKVKLIVDDLYKIRFDKEATRNYYNQILVADKRQDKYTEWVILHQKYGALEREPQYIIDKEEVDKEDVSSVRNELLKTVQNDLSFSYITSFLTNIQNNEIGQLEIEQAIREEQSIELEVMRNRIIELEVIKKKLSEEINSLNELNLNSHEIEQKGRTMKVTTNVLVKLLKLLDIEKNKNADGTKIANFIHYITGYSQNTIRMQLTNEEELTSSHEEEIEKVNHLLKDLNINISIIYNKQR